MTQKISTPFYYNISPDNTEVELSSKICLIEATFSEKVCQKIIILTPVYSIPKIPKFG